MKAGDLRHRIKIQSVIITNDVEDWPDFAVSVPAAIEPLKGREYWEAQKINAEQATKIRIRFRTGVLPTMRVVWGTRIYKIEAVMNIDERNRELHLVCVEVIN